MPPVRSVAHEKNTLGPPGPALPRDWQARYLDEVRQRGNFALPARKVGLSIRTVQRYRLADPEFDAACREAREEAADLIEDTMVDSAIEHGQPAGFIVRLKALRPAEYIERHAIMNVQVSTTLSADDGADLLRRLLATASDPTRDLLAAPPPALPAAAKPIDSTER